MTKRQLQYLIDTQLEFESRPLGIFVGCPDVDVILHHLCEAETARVKALGLYLHQFPFEQWLLGRMGRAMACGLVLNLQDGDKWLPTDANHISTLCGMEPRPYFSAGEVLAMMNASMGMFDAVVPAETIRALGSMIQRHPSVLGQKDRPWSQVYAWATRETYIPFLREMCLRYGDQIVRDLTSPYRKVYFDVMEQPAVAALDLEQRRERGKAAAVRAFLTEFYYQLTPATVTLCQSSTK